VAVNERLEVSFLIPQGLLPWQPIFVWIIDCRRVTRSETGALGVGKLDSMDTGEPIS